MTSITPRIIITALAVLALAAPAASAMPSRDNFGTTPAPRQDLRNADNRAPRPEDAVKVPAQQPETMKPVVLTPQSPAPVADDDPSPLLFILPGLGLVGMVGVAVVYVRSSRRPARV